jgi:hypothetical protein
MPYEENSLVTDNAATYDASNIQRLSGIEHVRLRPGMYIGGTGERALHHLVYEAVDNAVDEVLAGRASHIEIVLHDDGSVSVTDDGAGIPVEIHKETGIPALQMVMTETNTGGKFNNNAYAGGSTLKELHRPHWVNPDWNGGWGLGFGIYRDKDKTWVGHGGAVLGHFTLQRFNPDDKVGVIVLTNATGGDTNTYFQEIVRALAPIAVKTLAKSPEKATFKPEWERYIGAYRGPWGDSYVLREGDHLKLKSLQFPELPAGVLIPEGEDGRTFRMKEGGNEGELVIFVTDETGVVTRMHVAGEYSSPMP